jgi:altronate dehydratase small subunit
MTDPVNSILIDETDDVATAIVDLSRGSVGRYFVQGAIAEIEITENIPRYHKYAVRDIRKTELVRKYGANIGQATQDICRGTHVHIHNITNPGR